MTTLCVNWSGCEVLATATYSPTVGIHGNSEAAHHYFVHFAWFLMTAQDQILAFSMTRQLHYIRTTHSIGRRINKRDPICSLSLCDFPTFSCDAQFKTLSITDGPAKMETSEKAVEARLPCVFKSGHNEFYVFSLSICFHSESIS